MGLQPTFQYNYSADNVIVGTTGMDDVAMLMGERTLVEKKPRHKNILKFACLN